jgi:hypothetical protein
VHAISTRSFLPSNLSRDYLSHSLAIVMHTALHFLLPLILFMCVRADPVPSLYSEMLARQNQFRAIQGNTGLQWNDSLADRALIWASRCKPVQDLARNSAMLEGDSIYFETFVPPISSFLLQAVNKWHNETELRNGSDESSSSTLSNWNGYRSFGCAFASCLSSGMVYCRYYPTVTAPLYSHFLELADGPAADTSGRSAGYAPSPSTAVAFSSANPDPPTTGSSSGGALLGYICAALLFVLILTYKTKGCRGVCESVRTWNFLCFF